MFIWSEINPAIFGAIFQGVMDQEERRSLGAHYTSEENILKVLEALFLDDLYDEFERSKNTVRELESFHEKLASLTFLDSACGSGNFLVMTYQKLRELEFEVLKMIHDSSQLRMVDIFVKVSIDQFYGIEYEEFPTEVAKVSMLLIKHLMDQRVSNHFGFNLIDFPVKENANILNANALRVDWNDLIDAVNLDYIIGNPPFVGARIMASRQKKDIHLVLEGIKNIGNLDYVSAWYAKAADMIEENKDLKAAFVSTNSICQGEQVAILWKYFRQWYGAREFINNEPRYCLYLGDANPRDLRKMPLVIERIENVRKLRLKSKSEGTRKIADIPTKFHITNISNGDYLLIPETSSENRKYIPIGFMNKESLASNAVRIMPNATTYHFGILTSNVHNAWIRMVGGRLKSDYRYSKNIVYNNFPWPQVDKASKDNVAEYAKAVLNVRKKYSDWSYADLYGVLFMPKDLIRAHRELDKAVWEAYGRAWNISSEKECVSHLMKIYNNLIRC
ncbi:MAG: class I SAM-dependent DNA methyltransferase [Clostridiales bacterium]|nr:class I SAM-dependent DNA methyltransferase [Clostridiales bacterium]